VRDECVNQLLSITPNAIHLKLVYRHLMQWRQNRVSEFIDMRQALDGTFFFFFFFFLVCLALMVISSSAYFSDVRRLPRGVPILQAEGAASAEDSHEEIKSQTQGKGNYGMRDREVL
jgi:hypothetical protein